MHSVDDGAPRILVASGIFVYFFFEIQNIFMHQVTVLACNACRWKAAACFPIQAILEYERRFRFFGLWTPGRSGRAAGAPLSHATH